MCFNQMIIQIHSLINEEYVYIFVCIIFLRPFPIFLSTLGLTKNELSSSIQWPLIEAQELFIQITNVQKVTIVCHYHEPFVLMRLLMLNMGFS